MNDDHSEFQAHRSALVALAYRMLGDAARAQDLVQDAWLRWSARDRQVVVDSPRAYLVTIVTRLCLNELDSARSRREERTDRLPEPVALSAIGIDRLEQTEQIGMALLVLLERLSPAERAVLLLHEVFDFAHDEIAPLVGRTPTACRKLLERARERVAEGRRLVTAPRAQQVELLEAFVAAVGSGDVSMLVGLLAPEAVLITDGGAGGRQVGSFRNLRAPLVGAERIAHFVQAASAQAGLTIERRELNGQPGIVLSRDGQIVAAVLLAVADGKIQQIFFHADAARLRFVG